MSLRVRGTSAITGEPIELFTEGAVFTDAAADGSAGLTGWVLPGLVDAHCHVGIRYGGGDEDREGALTQARTERDVGVLLLRDAGSPIDTRFADDDPELPVIVRAGRHIAAPKRYIRGLGIDLDDETQLPEVVAQQARAGDGWVKLVGDWIDREVGDLRPLWSDAVLVDAMAAAHENGARVTAHVFGEHALAGLIDAGIDCIEHGTGLTDETIAAMVERQVALVPTLVNIATFPEIASGAAKFPQYREHMLDLHARRYDTIAAAHGAGIAIYTGTDAGGGIVHGRIVDEIVELTKAGFTSAEAVAAGSWLAREWLGFESLTGQADFTVYASDPRENLAELREPTAVVLRGQVYRRVDSRSQ